MRRSRLDPCEKAAHYAAFSLVVLTAGKRWKPVDGRVVQLTSSCMQEEEPASRGFGPTPRPADRGSLFARSGRPALTRAQNIHVLLSAIPGRQGAAPRRSRCDASLLPCPKPSQ